MSWENFDAEYEDPEEMNSLVEPLQTQQKFRTHNPFGVRRVAVVGSYADVLGLDQTANCGSSFFTKEVVLRLPKNFTKTGDNGIFCPLLQIENNAPCTIPRGSIIEKVSVWRKNKSKDVDANLSIVLGYDITNNGVSKDTKDFYADRIFSRSNPLAGSLLQIFGRIQRSQKVGLDEFAESLPMVKTEYQTKEKRLFPELKIESLNLTDEIGEPFDLRPVVCVQSGSVCVGDIGISILYSPPLSE
jgi:hypothetical protein